MNTLSSLLSAAGLLLLGTLSGALPVQLWGPPAGQTPLPPWAFALVWTLLYPCLGVGLQRARGTPGLTSALCAVTLTLAWMPLACAAQHPQVTVMLDLQAWVVMWLATWSQGPEVRPYFLPAAAWMPVTTALSAMAALA
ncbi:MAG: tryptophan-rich sensory protein [Alphaproteobacteria bacterium]|nr:tryptophan-rich sensory protein [Alphaproteobacteria bacterium]